MCDPFAAGSELHVAPLHPVELVFAGGVPLFTLLDHRVPVCELAAEYVAEYFGVAVRVRGEASVWGDAVFVEDTEGAERYVGWVVVVGERNCRWLIESFRTRK